MEIWPHGLLPRKGSLLNWGDSGVPPRHGGVLPTDPRCQEGETRLPDALDGSYWRLFNHEHSLLLHLLRSRPYYRHQLPHPLLPPLLPCRRQFLKEAAEEQGKISSSIHIVNITGSITKHGAKYSGLHCIYWLLICFTSKNKIIDLCSMSKQFNNQNKCIWAKKICFVDTCVEKK